MTDPKQKDDSEHKVVPKIEDNSKDTIKAQKMKTIQKMKMTPKKMTIPKAKTTPEKKITRKKENKLGLSWAKLSSNWD